MAHDDIDHDELQKAVAQKKREKEQEAQGDDSPEPEISDEELEARAEKKRKIAQLLDRGVVNDRLDAEKMLGDEYDEDLYYEWVRETDSDIERMKALDFHIVTVKESEEKTHDAGDNRVRVGDVILMACDREHHELIMEAKEEKKREKYGEPTQEYMRRARAGGAPPIGQSAQQVN